MPYLLGMSKQAKRNEKGEAKTTHAWTTFDKWFAREGHWLYLSRERAIETWRRIGIDGLPNYRPLH